MPYPQQPPDFSTRIFRNKHNGNSSNNNNSNNNNSNNNKNNNKRVVDSCCTGRLHSNRHSGSGAVTHTNRWLTKRATSRLATCAVLLSAVTSSERGGMSSFAQAFVVQNGVAVSSDSRPADEVEGMMHRTHAAFAASRCPRSRNTLLPALFGPGVVHHSLERPPRAYLPGSHRRPPCRGIAGPAPWTLQSRKWASHGEKAAATAAGGEGWRARRIGQSGGLDAAVETVAGESDGSDVAAGGDEVEDDAMVDKEEEGEGAGEGSWVKKRWKYAIAKIKKEPLQTLTIPVSAACVGWITNKLAVEMIFHPLVWRGIPLKIIEGQPLGLIGWQGIVPAKAGVMAERMVDMVTTQLVDVEEVFGRLSPGKVSRLLGPEVNSIVQSVYEDLAPGQLGWLPAGFGSGLPSQAVDELKGLRRGMLVGLTKDMQKHVHKILDLKEMVVGEMLRDRSLMVSLFQRCGKAEFKFLVNSGFFFGFLLGVVQMFVWLLYDKPWTLPAGGAVVGYITNWLAIKLIFEPVDPVKMGPFVLQGLFLKRQDEVAADFAEFFANNVLTSNKLWQAMVFGSRAEAFRELVTARVVPFLSRSSAVAGVNLDPLTVKSLAARAADKLRDHVHVLHDYTDQTLALRETMTVQMQKMSTRTFEGVLHPVFQEEEFTLIAAGAILGAIAGFLQMLLSTKGVREAARKAAARAAETAATAAGGVVEAGDGLVGSVGESVQVARAAQARAVRWKARAGCTVKWCTDSTRQVVVACYRSLSAAGRAAAAAVVDRYHRRGRRKAHGNGDESAASCDSETAADSGSSLHDPLPPNE